MRGARATAHTTRHHDQAWPYMYCQAWSCYLQGMTWTPAVVPALVAPVWGRQPEETPKAFEAFQAWLLSTTPRDWAAAARVAELGLEQVRTLAQRWVWEARARAFMAAQRQAYADTFQIPAVRDALADVMAVRLRAHKVALELEALELEKMLAKAKGEQPAPGSPIALPNALDARELAAIRRVNVQAHDALRREADGLPPVDDDKGGNSFEALSPDELELYRRLRDKAAV